MTLDQQLGVRRWSASGPGVWLLAVAGVLTVAVIVAIAIAGRGDTPSGSSTDGSGVSVTDHREVGPFAGVDLGA